MRGRRPKGHPAGLRNHTASVDSNSGRLEGARTQRNLVMMSLSSSCTLMPHLTAMTWAKLCRARRVLGPMVPYTSKAMGSKAVPAAAQERFYLASFRSSALLEAALPAVRAMGWSGPCFETWTVRWKE